MKWTCPGCSNSCEFALPKMFDLPLPEFPILALPTLTFPTIPAIPTLPSLPDPLFKFAGTLPTFSFKAWSANNDYVAGDKINVEKPIAEGEKGARKTILTYTAQNTGKGGDGTGIVWGKPEVVDGQVTLKLTNSTSGTPGSCPNSQGSKK